MTYVRDGYVPTLLRITEKEENSTESEFIHLRMDAVPCIRRIKINPRSCRDNTKCSGRKSKETSVVGDMNATVNPDSKNVKPAGKLMLAWKNQEK